VEPPRRTVTLYTRQGCHLCDETLALLRRLRDEMEFQIREVDVDSDPALAERYGDRVPVVTYGYREVIASLISERRLRDALRRAMGRAL
jgi:glutaredoxin